MAVSEADRKIVDNLFRAMQAGPAGEEQMMALFADDAIFVEPFSGAPKTHTGLDAIRASFRDMWAEPVPDMKLTLDRIDLDGDRLRAEWTCTASVFPVPMRGSDLFTIESGKIARLEIEVTEMPQMGV